MALAQKRWQPVFAAALSAVVVAGLGALNTTLGPGP
jgi:hypothetical protein